jgi:hypothetical protein
MINLYNEVGELVKSLSYATGTGQQTISLPVSELPKGMYMLELKLDSNYSVIRKIAVL